MRDLGTRLRRLSRPVRIAVQLGILAVIVMAVGTVGFIEYSAQPSFCDNCHIMEPYYESWKNSSHNDVKCIECHYAPGIRAEAMGKVQAANQVVKYVTGTYGAKPWAEIEDAACLRGGCHTERKLEVTRVFEGVRFNHEEHLGELRRGKQLRCTSCHSQIVQGEHLTVTESTCFLCHFKDRPPGEPIAGCVGCHPSPPTVVSPEGFEVNHEMFVEQRTSCVSCHHDVTSGDGAAERDRCFQCHNQPERIEQFDDTTRMHQVHIAEHNVECAQCHQPIDHRVVTLSASFDLECRSCHGGLHIEGTHDDAQQMFAGVGGNAVETMPSPHYQARVACEGCHRLPGRIEGHIPIQRAGEAACLSCHGVRYAGILEMWREGLDRRLDRVEGIVRGAEGAIGRVPAEGRTAADSLLALARENVDLVGRGRGVHNVPYADRLMRAAVDLTRDAVERSGAAYRVPELEMGGIVVSGSECMACHLGVEGRQVAFAGTTFSHTEHVAEAGMECSECHTGLDAHGGTTLESRQDCESCHHGSEQAASCATCHGSGGPRGTVRRPAGNFSHPDHVGSGIGCAECHTRPSMATPSNLCASCHDRHHVSTAACLDCHRGGALASHERSAHQGCAACHGQKIQRITEWSREVCTACHADRTDHNEGLRCERCHRVPPLRGGS